jgi:hypothetical protein|tara:strand:+ start:3311 stop:4165 length:855 start_codon:yes stop_codon:yes gene_type:complete
MKIKHSKYKNTGLIFELLVKQIAADTLSKKDSPAVSIIKKYFTGKTSLAAEFKLYEFVINSKGINQKRAETILTSISEVARKISQASLKKQKYDLISTIKESYDVEEFFSIQVRNYKPLAALYCLFESYNSTKVLDPKSLVDNKMTILEHLTDNSQDKNKVKDSLIEEYSGYDKDLKLLTFKILLEKFNDNYKDLLPEQKNILREFITSVNSTARLRNVVNEELTKISKIVNTLSKNIKDEVVKIKLAEVSKSIVTLNKKETVKDTHLVNLMQYYDLVNELRSL